MSKAILTAGLGFGDEGKGTIVDALSERYINPLVIRYNGGPQCAHNVISSKGGYHHTFAQFGSGTFAGAPTYLSEYMLINPLSMEHEATFLQKLGFQKPFLMLYVSPKAEVITPYHRHINRIREIVRKGEKHGSCGHGVGATVEFNKKYPWLRIRAIELEDAALSLSKLQDIRLIFLNEAQAYVGAGKLSSVELQLFENNELLIEYVARWKKWFGKIQFSSPIILKNYYTLIFEGAQGFLLDQKFGFPPYYTWSDITFNNAYKLLKEIDFPNHGNIHRLGVTRTYSTRHGAGPFVAESKELAGLLGNESHNTYNKWQEDFRVGWLDFSALRYAAKNLGIDSIAVTHVDTSKKLIKKFGRMKVVQGYNNWGLEKYTPTSDDPSDEITKKLFASKPRFCHCEGIITEITKNLGKPVSIVSSGPTSKDKMFWMDFAIKKISLGSLVPKASL